MRIATFCIISLKEKKMLFKNKTDYLIESIRKGRAMTRREKLNLIVGLSVPSMLAQISTVMMFFIDASWWDIWEQKPRLASD